VSIRFACPQCGKRIETAERFAGRAIDCPRCGLKMTIPSPDERSEAAALAQHEASQEPTATPERPAPFEPAVAAVVAVSPASPRLARPQPGRKTSSTEGPLITPSPKIDFEDLIDMTAMVDIVFFLLIFFLVTSMHALDSTIPLPAPDAQASTGEKSSAAGDADDSSIVVNIDRHDTIRIEGAEVYSARDLLFKLRDLKNGPGRPDKLLVVGSSDATHGTAVMVLDAGHEVGMESVRMAVRDEIE
jgi:biopolymer transport protein ExbD